MLGVSSCSQRCAQASGPSAIQQRCYPVDGKDAGGDFESDQEDFDHFLDHEVNSGEPAFTDLSLTGGGARLPQSSEDSEDGSSYQGQLPLDTECGCNKK